MEKEKKSGCGKRLAGSLLVEQSFSLFDVAELDAGSLGEGKDGLLAEADDENVSESGGELVAFGVSNVSDVEGTGVLLNVGEDSDLANGVSLGDVHVGALFELQDSVDLAGLEV